MERRGTNYGSAAAVCKVYKCDSKAPKKYYLGLRQKGGNCYMKKSNRSKCGPNDLLTRHPEVRGKIKASLEEGVAKRGAKLRFSSLERAVVKKCSSAF